MEQLIWIPVDGYELEYHVSNKGDIKSLSRLIINRNGKPLIISKERRLLPTKTSRGYLKIGFVKDFKQKSIFVHRVVARAFIPNPENKPFINHKNGIKGDNDVYNLEWCTAKENNSHAIANKLMCLGEKKWNAKLTAIKATEIKLLKYHTNLSYKKLSKIYNISPTAVAHIIKGRSWAHI